MSKVNVVNVLVLDNPCFFNNQFQFEIVFDSYEDLPEDLEWKIIYVGSAESEEYDQVLDSVLVGPIPAGTHKFLFQAPPPDSSKIPVADCVGITVLLLTCSYKEREFVRIGYYVNVEYADPEIRENPPAIPDFTKLQRNILATNPRVTKFTIDWGESVPNNNQIADNNNVTSPTTENNIHPPNNISSTDLQTDETRKTDTLEIPNEIKSNINLENECQSNNISMEITS
ncbi:unnamed protein product [Gordionus sp. m RMFG-2023]|uniref:histone chaperone asf1b-B-like n=1 Tax=Gordionus sp. m RMFG-2023 TaxID=3053472 RepID=UPI0030E10B01